MRLEIEEVTTLLDVQEVNRTIIEIADFDLQQVQPQPGGGAVIHVHVGDGSAVPVTGVVGVIRAPASRRWTFKRWTVLEANGVSGSCQFDIRKSSFASYSATVPGSSDSMVGAAAKPALSAAIKAEDDTLTDWTSDDLEPTEVARIVLESASGVKSIDLLIEIDVVAV